MKKIMDFLFGRFPQIFTKKGEVRHNLAEESWRHWKDRYQHSREYNWRSHKGTRQRSS